MRAERVYVVSILVGLTVAGLVGWQILSARDTDCFLRSINISIAHSTNLPKGCKSEAFTAVKAYIHRQRHPVQKTLKPKETDEVKARSALLVWVALLTTTAGFAGFVAVQSVVTVWELKPPWNASLIAASVGAAILLALPFVLYLLLPKRFTHLGQFDNLHHGQLTWMNLMGASWCFPRWSAWSQSLAF